MGIGFHTYNMENKILIGIPNGSGMLPHETVMALLQLRKPCPSMAMIIPRQRTDKCRNHIVQLALENGITHLLFVDDDNPPPVDTIEKFMEDDKDIVCSPIPTRNPDKDGNHTLCIFEKYQVEEGVAKGMNMYRPINKIDTSAGHLVRVGGCGMGCTMIKRHVLETLWKKYEGEPFAYGDTTYTQDSSKMNVQRRTMSEDMEFIERATEEGFEVWCDTRIRAPHLGNARVYTFGDQYIK